MPRYIFLTRCRNAISISVSLDFHVISTVSSRKTKRGDVEGAKKKEEKVNSINRSFIRSFSYSGCTSFGGDIYKCHMFLENRTRRMVEGMEVGWGVKAINLVVDDEVAIVHFSTRVELSTAVVS